MFLVLFILTLIIFIKSGYLDLYLLKIISPKVWYILQDFSKYSIMLLFFLMHSLINKFNYFFYNKLLNLFIIEDYNNYISFNNYRNYRNSSNSSNSSNFNNFKLFVNSIFGSHMAYAEGNSEEDEQNYPGVNYYLRGPLNHREEEEGLAGWIRRNPENVRRKIPKSEKGIFLYKQIIGNKLYIGIKEAPISRLFYIRSKIDFYSDRHRYFRKLNPGREKQLNTDNYIKLINRGSVFFNLNSVMPRGRNGDSYFIENKSRYSINFGIYKKWKIIDHAKYVNNYRTRFFYFPHKGLLDLLE